MMTERKESRRLAGQHGDGTGNQRRVASAALPHEHYERIRTIAEKRHVTVSDVVREAVDAYVEASVGASD